MEEILVAYDDSDAARAALAWAIGYARGCDREILLVYVVSSLEEWELAAVQVNPGPIRRSFEQLLRTEWSRAISDSHVQYRTRLLVGRPAEAILACARAEHAALIVLGMTSHGILYELVARSTARHVLHEARRPVVAVPARWTPAANAGAPRPGLIRSVRARRGGP